MTPTALQLKNNLWILRRSSCVSPFKIKISMHTPIRTISNTFNKNQCQRVDKIAWKSYKKSWDNQNLESLWDSTPILYSSMISNQRKDVNLCPWVWRSVDGLNSRVDRIKINTIIFTRTRSSGISLIMGLIIMSFRENKRLKFFFRNLEKPSANVFLTYRSQGNQASNNIKR